MSDATQVKEPVQPSMSAKERTAERTKRGPVLRQLAQAARESIAALGQALAEVRDDLFTVSEVKAGKLDAYVLNWTGLSASTWKGYVRAGEILSQLSESQRTAVASWPIDGIKDLGPLDEDQRAAVLKLVKGTHPDTKTIRVAREKVRPMSMRNVASGAEKTTKLAERISERVLSAIGDDPTRYVLLITGAQIAQDHKGEDVAAAMLFLSTQTAVAASVVK